MSVNFCLPQLQPKVTTSTVCSDGYGEQNLINFNPFKGGWKGFMAESFIKPPVDITIQFPINICIEKIVLDPCVGRQKSSGFEIYSSCVLENKTGKDDDKTEPIITRIGNTLIPWSNMSENTCILRFINNSYRGSFPDIRRLSPRIVEAKGPEDVERFLRMASPGAVENVNRITIRITRTHGGSVIAMRSVQVWGEPSLRIPKTSQLWALKIIENMYKIKAPAAGDSASKQTSSTNKSTLLKKTSVQNVRSPSEIEEETKECPEDFLDPITCQMIMLPVLLPSGHTVDRSTLDRHNEIEAVWGRPANDPFTGVAFSGKSQPVPNAKLKTRIDQYLLMSGDKHLGLARDVGRTDAGAAGPSASTLVSKIPISQVLPNHVIPQQVGNRTKVNRQLELKCGKSPLLNVNTPKETNHRTQRTPVSSHPKRNLDSRDHQSRHQQPLVKKAKLSTTGVRRGNQCAGLSILPADASQSAANSKGSMSHEDSLTDSLDSALNQALGSLPSYSSRTSLALTSKASTNGFSHTPSSSCTVCQVEANTALGGETQPAVILYRLPCMHLICRTCLVTVASSDKSGAPNHVNETRFCASCGRTYRKDDVVRVHL